MTGSPDFAWFTDALMENPNRDRPACQQQSNIQRNILDLRRRSVRGEQESLIA